MRPKNERTVDHYKWVGAYFRLLKDLTVKSYVAGMSVVPKSERRVMETMWKKVVLACGRAEASMWNDHPELSEEYRDVFSGSTSNQPIREIDKEVIRIARGIADSLVWRDKDGKQC